MKKKQFKIQLHDLSEQELNQAPHLVKEMYQAIRENAPIANDKKLRAVQKFPEYFTILPKPTFSKAFKRFSSIKQAITINQKKKQKELKGPGVIQFSGEVNSPESVEGLRKLIG